MVTHSIPEALLLADRVLVLGSRPGHIRLVLDVPLERPRDMSMEYSATFGALAGAVRQAIEM
jgi:NitT/TauT family transport system ATP-binding protein